MGVAAENQIHSGPRGTAHNNGIMGQQEFQLVFARSRESKRQIFEPNHRVINASQPESGAVFLETHALVN